MSNLGNGGLQLGDLTQESSREQTQRQGHLLLQLCATCNLLDRRSCQAAGHERTGTGKRMAGVHKDLLQVLLNGACTAPERTVLIALLLGFIRSCPPCCHRTNRSPTNARTEKNRTEKNKKKRTRNRSNHHGSFPDFAQTKFNRPPNYSQKINV